MNRRRYTATVIITSIILGLTAGITLNTDIVEKGLQEGETHEHALFYMEVNKTPLNLRADRFQLQDRDVHLENNRSRIVHKHAEGISWGDFLDTVNISIERENQTCIEMPENSYCGNTTVLLNGEKFDREKEIHQGDRLAIVQGTNSKERAEAYMELTMPEEYRKIEPGRMV